MSIISINNTTINDVRDILITRLGGSPTRQELEAELVLYKIELREIFKRKLIVDPFGIMGRLGRASENPAKWLESLNESELDTYIIEDTQNMDNFRAFEVSEKNKKDSILVKDKNNLSAVDIREIVVYLMEINGL